MMFKVMAFKFCPIHIKHQTFNFKLEKRCLHATALFLSPLFSVRQGNRPFRPGKGAAFFFLPYTILNEMTVMIADRCEVLSYVTLYQ